MSIPRSARSMTASEIIPEAIRTGTSRARSRAFPIGPGPYWSSAPGGTSPATDFAIADETGSALLSGMVRASRAVESTTIPLPRAIPRSLAARGKLSFSSISKVTPLSISARIQATSVPKTQPAEALRNPAMSKSGRRRPDSKEGTELNRVGT